MPATSFSGLIEQAGGSVIVVLTIVNPIISNIVESPAAETTQTITWDTDIVSDTQICRDGVGVSGGAHATCTTLDPTYVLAHSATFTGLAASSTYYYVVKSNTLSGGIATSGEGSFTTAASSSCGPPTYPCGDTSSTNRTWQTWPIEALTVNSVFSDPVFGTQMVRAVDTSVNPCDVAGRTAVGSGISDSAENNLWASDSSHYIVRLDLSGNTALLLNDFNATTLQSSAHPGTGSGSCRKTIAGGGNSNWLEVSGSGRFKASGGAAIFSYHNPSILFGVDFSNPVIIRQLDVSGSPTFSIVKTLTDADCFTDLSTSGTGDTSVSVDGDRLFWFGNKNSDAVKGQDHYTQFVVYIRSTGVCRRWDSSTGIISEGTTASGYPVGTTASTFRASTSHNARMSKDGTRVTVTFQSCSAGCTGFSNTGRVAWNFETTDILLPVVGGNTNTIGHAAMGSHSLVSGFNNGSVYHNLFNLTANPIVTDLRATTKGIEHYLAWNNADTGDTYPYLYNAWHIDGMNDSTQVTENENSMITSTGAIGRSRQNKICTFATTGAISLANPRAAISSDGRFILYTDRGNACSRDIGRADLFIVKTQ